MKTDQSKRLVAEVYPKLLGETVKKLCEGTLGIWTHAGKHQVDYWEAQYDSGRPTGVKRERLRCPECGRKLLSSVKYCHGGCCILHYLPPHKPKGWWKKKKKL